MNRRQALTGVAAAAAATVLVTPERAGAHTGDHGFPTIIPLPDNWLPEGITISSFLPFAYFGSRRDGSIYRANLASGHGKVIHTGPGVGFPSVGLKIDPLGRLFVAGGNAGQARVVSAIGGRLLATYQFTTATSFINDCVLTPAGPYFTNSFEAALYHLPLGPFGSLPAPDAFRRIPLGGAWEQVAGFNANGITRTPDGGGLIVVNSQTGRLFRIDPADGTATAVTIAGGAVFTGGDGMLLDGTTLYIVRNAAHILAIIRLSGDGTSGTLLREEPLPSPPFDVPTTVAKFSSRATGDRLYFPNAKFRPPGQPVPTTFEAVGIPIPRG